MAGSCCSLQETPASHLLRDSDLVLEDLKYEVIIYLLSGFFLQGGLINLDLSTMMRFYCDFLQ